MALSDERTFLVGEGDELKSLLATVLENSDPSILTPAAKRITDIMDTYLEQPYLLDPHLEPFISPIMRFIRMKLRSWHAASVDERSAAEAAGLVVSFQFQVLRDPHLNALLQLVYHACKTRGYKHIVKLFPHEVADVEPAVQALCCQVRAYCLRSVWFL
jgi:hypothetical protein